MGNAEPQPYVAAFQPLLPPPAVSPAVSPASTQVVLTATLISESCVERNSFRLIASSSPAIAHLDLCYNSNVECTLKVHYFCTDDSDPATRTKTFTTDLRRFPSPVEIHLPKAYHQPLSQAVIPIALDTEEALLTFKDTGLIPIVVEIVPDRSEGPQAHISYLCFSQEGGVWKPKLLQQLLLIQGRYFVLHEFFGVQRHNHPDEESAECVVCMTDRRNTAVLPCRHVCLCTNCANIVRSQPSSKCPICRSQVDSLMQLVGESESS